MVQQGAHHLAAQLRQRVVALALQRAHVVQKAGDGVAQFLLGIVNFGAALAREGAGVGFGQRLALGAEQGENHMPLVAREAKAQRLGQRIQFGKGLGLAGLVGLFDARALGAEVGAVQALGDVGLQRARELLHALAQHAPLACRQAQRARALGVVKVVQVAQVGGHGPLGGGLLHGLVQQ